MNWFYQPLEGAAQQQAGAGTQTLTATRFTNTSTFGAHTITPGAVTLTATLVSDGDTFGAHTITQGGATENLTATLLSDADTFGAHTVAATYSLTATRYTNTSTFGAHTVTPGAISLTATRVSDGDTFGSHTLTPGAVALSATAFTDADSFGAHTVTSGGGPTQSLTATLYSDPDTFGSHNIGGATEFQPGDYAPVIYLDRNNRPVGLKEVKKQALEAVPEAVEPKVEAAIERIEELAGNTAAFDAVAAQYELLARLVQAFDDALAMELEARAREAQRRADDEHDIELLMLAI